MLGRRHHGGNKKGPLGSAVMWRVCLFCCPCHLACATIEMKRGCETPSNSAVVQKSCCGATSVLRRLYKDVTYEILPEGTSRNSCLLLRTEVMHTSSPLPYFLHRDSAVELILPQSQHILLVFLSWVCCVLYFVLCFTHSFRAAY